jgi:hypothetical protein
VVGKRKVKGALVMIWNIAIINIIGSNGSFPAVKLVQAATQKEAETEIIKETNYLRFIFVRFLDPKDFPSDVAVVITSFSDLTAQMVDALGQDTRRTIERMLSVMLQYGLHEGADQGIRQVAQSGL